MPITLAYLEHPSPCEFANRMAPPVSHPHISEDPAAMASLSEINLSNFLHITLKRAEAVLGASEIPRLHATVQNTAPHPITILTYNGLLDKAAGLLGIIHVIDDSTGDETPSDKVQFQRLWPPPRDAFVEVASNDKVEVEIPLRTHQLKADTKYQVVAKWAWQGLWKGGVDVALEACSNNGDTAAGSGNGPTTEVQIQGSFELPKEQ